MKGLLTKLLLLISLFLLHYLDTSGSTITVAVAAAASTATAAEAVAVAEAEDVSTYHHPSWYPIM